MINFNKLGLAAVLALGVSGAAIAQDAGVGADVGLDAGAQTELNAGKAGASGKVGAGASADVGLDTMTTGSINNHGNLVSSIQTSTSFDVSGYSDGSEISCIKTSSLQGNAQGNAKAIGNAAMGNPGVSTLRSEIQANTNLMTALQAQCDVAQFDLDDVVFVETSADGKLVFYYDDSAA
jgi:hypothetical protein